MKVYAKSVRRRETLSGKHLEEFDKAIEWARLGAKPLAASDATPLIGSQLTIRRKGRMKLAQRPRLQSPRSS